MRKETSWLWFWFTAAVFWVVFVAANQSNADVAAAVTTSTHFEGCHVFTLCNAETDTTAACDNGTDNIVAKVTGKTLFTFYATESTATTALACNIYTSSTGYSATSRGAITSAAALTELTLTSRVTAINGAFMYVWAECTTITGAPAAATIRMLACSGE